MFKFFAFVALLLTLGQAPAQQPSQAQRDAIRAACRPDFIANCSGVQPGGKVAQAETALPAAKVERAPPGIQVTPAETQNEQLKTVQQACTLNDFVAHCSWIAPDNPEILACLKGNAADLSPNCQAAVQSLSAVPPAAAAPSPPAEPAAR